MSARKPRIEEVVSAVTARLAAAHEIRTHAARLLEIASAQEGEARACARDALGDHGERLFHAVAGAYDHECEDASRIAEVPGLAQSLLAPWQAGTAPARAAAMSEPVRVGIPVPPAAMPASEVRPVAAPAPVPPPGLAATVRPPAPEQAPPAATGGRLLYGIEVPAANAAGAERIVAQAKAFVAAGDASQYELHGSKWVGVHQWRRDLFRAAFADEAAKAGLRLPDGEPVRAEAAAPPVVPASAGLPVWEPTVPPSPAEAPGGNAAAGPAESWADGGDGYEDDGYEGDEAADDVVFGEDEPPLPVAQAALDLREAPRPLPPFLADLEDTGDDGGDWPPARDGPPVKVAPGLYR